MKFSQSIAHSLVSFTSTALKEQDICPIGMYLDVLGFIFQLSLNITQCLLISGLERRLSD